MNKQFDAELSTALLGFNGEAVLYCQNISDDVPGYASHRTDWI